MAQTHRKSKIFDEWLLEKEAFTNNSMIFVDLQVSTNFGVSNGKLGLEFLL